MFICISESIKEITLVWNISYHKRCLLYDRGITTWDDPILLHNIYPYEIHESKREYIQEKMIHINSQNELKIQPRKIKNQKFDKQGYYASIGKVDKKIINRSIENEFFKKTKSLSGGAIVHFCHM